MRYVHDREGSLHWLRTALPLMARQPAALHPLCYAIWYEHVSGMNGPLSQALESRLASGLALTNDEVAWLYETYIDQHRTAANERLAHILTTIMQEIVRGARSSGADIKRFLAALEQSQQALGQPLEQLALRLIVTGLIGDTAKMRTVTSELADRIATSAEEVSRLQVRLRKAETDALTDTLTGLRNRRGFEDGARAYLSSTATFERSVLLFLDLDHFKRINDCYGHVLGDKVLRAVAQIIQSSIKGRDIAARIGGEEFAILLPDTTLEGAVALAEQVRNAIAKGEIREPDGEPIDRLTVSIGVAVGCTADTLEALTRRADAGLYRAKNQGRNRVCGPLGGSDNANALESR
jgi:diguanylate cyclase